MFNLLTIFLTLFSNIFNINDKYLNVGENIDEVVVTSSDNYIVTKGDKYIISNDEINITLEDNIIDIIDINDIIYVLTSEQKIIIYKDNIVYKIINIEEALNQNILNCKLVKCDEELKVVGTTKQNDIFIMNEEKEYKIFTSEKNEKLVDALYYDNYLYLYIEKDEISEKPFGNGSSKVIAKVDSEVVKILNLDIEYINMFICNNLLYVITNNKIIIYDTSFNYKYENKIDDIKYAFRGYNGLLILFCDKNVYLLDEITLSIINEISTFKNDEIKNVIKTNKYFYIELTNDKYKFDVVRIDNVGFDEDCLIEYENYENVKSFFGICEKKERTYDNYFNKMFGLYKVKEEYITKSGISFNITFDYNVKLKTNIKENGIYKEGFNILFNSQAKLDGENVTSNCKVYGPGEHIITFEGVNVTKEIKFFVSSNQIEFTDGYIYDGIDVLKDTDIIIKLKFNDFESYNVYRINAKDEIIKDYKFENGLLEINFGKASEVKRIYIESIVFKIDDVFYTYYVNKLYNVNTIYENINIRKDDNKLFYVVDDKNKQSRMFNLIIYSNNNEYSYNYSIDNNELKILDKLTGKYNFKLSLITNNGNNVYKYNEIFYGVCELNESSSIGKIKVNVFDNVLDSFHITIDEEKVLQLKEENKIIYTKKINLKKTLIIGLICFISSFVICKVIKKVFIKNK